MEVRTESGRQGKCKIIILNYLEVCKSCLIFAGSNQLKHKTMTEYLKWRVDTLALLNEIADSAMDRKMGILKIPINIFKDLLADVAQRATELNDPELNILMLRLNLYEVPQNEIIEAIENQKKLIKPKS
jgi:hypothetical protein